MLRVVLDTNVVISALHFNGPPRKILELAVRGTFEPLTSPALLEELRDVIRTKFKYPEDTVELVLTEWTALNEIVCCTEQLTVITKDPDDDRVLECAVNGKADCIVSGDKHLLELKRFRDIAILSATDFLTSPHLS